MGIVENAKEIANLVKKAGDIELYRKIVELEEEIIELTRQNRQLEEKCDELEELLNTNERMHYDDPFYFQDGDEVPFCASCWENGKHAHHLTNHHYYKGVWLCQICGSKYVPKRKKTD